MTSPLFLIRCEELASDQGGMRATREVDMRYWLLLPEALRQPRTRWRLTAASRGGCAQHADRL